MEEKEHQVNMCGADLLLAWVKTTRAEIAKVALLKNC